MRQLLLVSVVFSDSDAAFRRDRLKLTTTLWDAPQRVAGRPPLPFVQVTVLYLTC